MLNAETKPARKPISKKKRFNVFKRDGFRCAYCGKTPDSDAVLEVDHINPVSGGGSDDEDNLITACFDCNRGKAATPLTCIPETLSEKARKIAEKEEQLKQYREVLRAEKDRKQSDIWEVAKIFMDFHGDDGIDRRRFNSIRSFLTKLPLLEVIDAMEIAVDKCLGRDRMFRYFCGICWKKISAGEEE